MSKIYKWLTKYQVLEREIKYLEFEISDYENELERWVSGDLYNVKIVKGSSGSKLEDIIKEKKEELNNLKRRKEELVNFIEKFDDLESQILIKKYIENESLEDIAEGLGYSYSHVRRLHANAIKAITIIDKMYH